MAPQNPNIAKRRALIYQRSATAFFYDLIHKDLDNDATFSSVFQVYRYDFEPLKIKETHHLKDSLNMHVVTLTFPPELIEDDTRPPSSLPIYDGCWCVTKI